MKIKGLQFNLNWEQLLRGREFFLSTHVYCQRATGHKPQPPLTRAALDRQKAHLSNIDQYLGSEEKPIMQCRKSLGKEHRQDIEDKESPSR